MREKCKRMRLAIVGDGGMSLVEVVIAISILAVLSTASLGVYLSGMNSAASLQRQQVAVTVANEVMENVYAWPVSGLYTGRGRVAVQNLWAAGTGIGGVNETYQAWDASAPVGSLGDVPVSNPTLIQRSGTTYKTQTFIGPCFQPVSGGDCLRARPLAATAPATPSGFTKLIRVIVVVRWDAGGSCGAGGCKYEAATIIDPNVDLLWNSNG